MQELCLLTDIADGEAKSFDHGDDSFFVVRLGLEAYGYHNACPHMGVELNYLPDEFMTSDKTMIQCSMHGAQFDKESGLCVFGPCQNQSLKKVNLAIENGKVYLDE